MRSFCLLNSIEQILIPICSLLQLYSNDMNSLKRIFGKNIYKKNTNKVDWSLKKVEKLTKRNESSMRNMLV